jgi:hypothetical protein
LFIGFLGVAAHKKRRPPSLAANSRASATYFNIGHWPTRSKLIFHLRQTITGPLLIGRVYHSAAGAQIDANMHHF